MDWSKWLAGEGGEGEEADLEGEDDDLVALGIPLQAGVAVGLEAREGRKRDLLFPRVLRRQCGPRAQ